MASEERETVTIGSLSKSGAVVGHKDGNYGSKYPRVEEFGPVGVPFLTAKSLRDGRIDIEGAPRLPEERANDLHFGFVQPGDVLLSHNATVGRVAVVPKYEGKLLIGTSLTYFRVDPAQISPGYLAAYFSGTDFQNQLAAVMSQSTRNQVPITAQRSLRIVMPPLREQLVVANILEGFDKKIILNRRMHETLESMARALFKSWFADFDPVRAKAEGRMPIGMDAETAALFPDSFEDSPLGKIPKRWEFGSILERAKLLSGGTPKTDREEYWNGDISWASAKDVSQCRELFLVETERRISRIGLTESATQLIPKFCVVVVARGATTGRMVLLGHEMAMNQTCYALATTTDSPFWLYCLLRNEVENLVHAAHGSVFDTITTSTFVGSRVVLPPKAVIESFEAQVVPLFQRILAATTESSNLTAIRDVLLPKLISGEIRIPHPGHLRRTNGSTND